MNELRKMLYFTNKTLFFTLNFQKRNEINSAITDGSIPRIIMSESWLKLKLS
jgi:hypothetical protein